MTPDQIVIPPGIKVIGGSGSRFALSRPQALSVKRLVTKAIFAGATTAHHGCCTGMDALFHYACSDEGMQMILHPPLRTRFLAHGLRTGRGDITLPPAPYEVRDKAVADAVQLLITAPRLAEGHGKSGTWKTIWFARTSGTRILVVDADGNITWDKSPIQEWEESLPDGPPGAADGGVTLAVEACDSHQRGTRSDRSGPVEEDILGEVLHSSENRP